MIHPMTILLNHKKKKLFWFKMCRFASLAAQSSSLPRRPIKASVGHLEESGGSGRTSEIWKRHKLHCDNGKGRKKGPGAWECVNSTEMPCLWTWGALGTGGQGSSWASPYRKCTGSPREPSVFQFAERCRCRGGCEEVRRDRRRGCQKEGRGGWELWGRPVWTLSPSWGRRLSIPCVSLFVCFVRRRVH